MSGTLYGVGLGPGDPELMTVKAITTIEHCDVIALPISSTEGKVAWEIALEMVPKIEEKEILSLSMPMTRDKRLLEESHQQAAEKIMAHLAKNQSVAFLTIGDPSIYSTYCYLHELVAKHYSVQMIAGVPSFCAVAAELNIPLGQGAQMIHIVPASYQGWEESLDYAGTKILMKAGKAIDQIKERLKDKQCLVDVMMVERCGMADEMIYKGIDAIDEHANYLSTIIVKEKGERR